MSSSSFTSSRSAPFLQYRVKSSGNSAAFLISSPVVLPSGSTTSLLLTRIVTGPVLGAPSLQALAHPYSYPLYFMEIYEVLYTMARLQTETEHRRQLSDDAV